MRHYDIYTLSLHDALPICPDDLEKIENKMTELAREKNEFQRKQVSKAQALEYFQEKGDEYKLELIDELEDRSEEHTSELQSRENLVCRLLLEKKKENKQKI